MSKLCFLVVPIVLLVAACDKPAHSQTASSSPVEPKPRAKPSYPPVQACGLVSNDELSAIQHATITDAKSSETTDGTYSISQCYYASREPNMSVSLALIQTDQKNPAYPSPRDYWKQVFNPANFDQDTNKDKKEQGDKGKGEEEEERHVPPRKIDGVGEAAYWSGTRVGGALYVLKTDFIVRVSVGGPDDEKTKIEKSKAVAEKAIGRLPAVGKAP